MGYTVLAGGIIIIVFAFLIDLENVPKLMKKITEVFPKVPQHLPILSHMLTVENRLTAKQLLQFFEVTMPTFLNSANISSTSLSFASLTKPVNNEPPHHPTKVPFFGLTEDTIQDLPDEFFIGLAHDVDQTVSKNFFIVLSDISLHNDEDFSYYRMPGVESLSETHFPGSPDDHRFKIHLAKLDPNVAEIWFYMNARYSFAEMAPAMLRVFTTNSELGIRACSRL
jgi:hypothetical protein